MYPEQTTWSRRSESLPQRRNYVSAGMFDGRLPMLLTAHIPTQSITHVPVTINLTIHSPPTLRSSTWPPRQTSPNRPQLKEHKVTSRTNPSYPNTHRNPRQRPRTPARENPSVPPGNSQQARKASAKQSGKSVDVRGRLFPLSAILSCLKTKLD